MEVDLSSYNNAWYKPGNRLKLLLWYFTNVLFFINPLNPSSKIKVILLKCFGAKLGDGVVIKPGVNIKYPWFLSVGNHCWIGENVWIDNLTQVTIEDHVCISQNALLLCGNHNYKCPEFNLILGKITLKKGAWVGAKAVVCPGVTLNSHAVLTVGSVATKDLDANMIYQGNPAIKIRSRN
ncbi:WcaF family extracellular polysaccharide biosynthesis acetyltransferase [Pseudotamlana agarivorans]|uniref:WcaF family extracellular polysaccharide biosynthesis acetyltransferase n=1 Tax=Pseudotamlana agarivorans TaxID=481183 RepID=UPI000829F016|nr:WcaF family extracellular polysaccharide biosynthesis acetyltransferase [Tamlana agarivorans]